MPRVAPRVPEPTDVLCERCGYVLNGLPGDGRCPECGKPVAESVGLGRRPTDWDVSGSPGPSRAAGFIKTTLDAIGRPAHFYRTFATRGSLPSARAFAQLHWLICGGLFGIAAATHTIWYWTEIEHSRPPVLDVGTVGLYVAVAVGLTIGSYLALDGVTRLAAGLTNWEGSYRGYRLPYAAVLRAMYYHAAHYLPVAAVTLATVLGYQAVLAVYPAARMHRSDEAYLYVLGGEVVLFAVYLFQTYWVGMRNMMYANR